MIDPAPWSAVFPFAQGDALSFRLSWMMMTLRGKAHVVANTGGALALECDVAEQKLFGQRIPAIRFAVAFDHRAEGGGNKARLKVGDKEAVDDDALIETAAAGDQRRVRVAYGPQNYAFTVVKTREAEVELRDLAGPKIPGGAKIRITPNR